MDARSMFDQQNAKADEMLRGIVDVLPEAVGTCVDAAAAELDVSRQAALLRVTTHPAVPEALSSTRVETKTCTAQIQAH